MPVLTPDAGPGSGGSAVAHSLILSDGVTDLELIGDGEGTYVVVDGFELPAPAPANAYVETPDSEGRRRLRTRYANVEGGVIRLRIDRFEDLAPAFWDEVDALLELVMSAHREKGTLTYTPAEGAEITYDLESIYISDLPQSGFHVASRRYEPTITFECQPFGKLAEVTVFEDEDFTGPAGSVVVTNIPGHADALVEFTLHDDSTQVTDWLEVTVERDGYHEGADLTIDSADLDDQGGSTVASGSAHGGNVIRQAVTTTPDNLVLAENLTHRGRKRISTRVTTSTEIAWVRGGWKVGEGASYSYGPWRQVPDDGEWHDVFLLAADIPVLVPSDHEVFILVQGYGEAATNIDVDYIQIMGAERRCVVRQPDGTLMGTGSNIDLFSDRVVRGPSQCIIEGDYLTLPPSTRAEIPLRLAVRRRREDIGAGGADDGITDDMTGTLIVTPRVALVSA
jgi:hypothetical protein